MCILTTTAAADAAAERIHTSAFNCMVIACKKWGMEEVGTA